MFDLNKRYSSLREKPELLWTQMYTGTESLSYNVQALVMDELRADLERKNLVVKGLGGVVMRKLRVLYERSVWIRVRWFQPSIKGWSLGKEIRKSVEKHEWQINSLIKELIRCALQGQSVLEKDSLDRGSPIDWRNQQPQKQKIKRLINTLQELYRDREFYRNHGAAWPGNLDSLSDPEEVVIHTKKIQEVWYEIELLMSIKGS